MADEKMTQNDVVDAKQAAKELQELHRLEQVRLEKLQELQAAGRDPFEIVTYDQTEHSADIKDNYDALEGKEVSLAGRMMSKRVMGKASFCHVQDLKGTIQCYVARDFIGEEAYAGFKKMIDVGDLIECAGEADLTEATVMVADTQNLRSSYTFLTSADGGVKGPVKEELVGKGRMVGVTPNRATIRAESITIFVR